MIWSFLKLFYNLFKISKDITTLNNKDVRESLKNNINNSGRIVIKVVQVIIPIIKVRNYIDDSELLNLVIKDFSIYYNNCYIHDIDYTLAVYKKDFNENISDKYDIIDIIGSGSVAQVYKIQNKKTKKLYAMKIVHPNIYYDFFVFNCIYKISKLFIKYKNALNTDYDLYILNIKKQFNMISEVKNMLVYKDIYQSTLIKVPEVFNFSENIIIMEYIKSDNIDELKQNLYRFTLHCIEYKYLLYHGDLHKGNILYQNDCMYILDFASVFEIPFSLSNLVFEININDYLKIINITLDYYENRHINKGIKNNFIDSFNKMYNKEDQRHDKYINLLIQFLSVNNIFIPLETLLILVNGIYFDDNTITPMKNIMIEIYNICSYHNIYPEFLEDCEPFILKKLTYNNKKYDELKYLIN